jgi:hypothetical protein
LEYGDGGETSRERSSGYPDAVARSGSAADQAQLPSFRLLLLGQAAVATILGVATFFVPAAVATVGGYTGHEHFYYRLAGAAVLGYAVAAVLAYTGREPWDRVRIALTATFAFNAASVLGCLLSLLDGDRHWPVFFVLVAATVFAVIAGYWLRRNQAPPGIDRATITPLFRWIIGIATIAAAFFGIVPLLFARPLASFSGFSADDLFFLRQAAAATFGYAVGGVMSLQANRYSALRVQTIAAAVFNGVSAVAAALYLIGGGRSLIGVLILVAATAFTVALVYGLARGRS